MLESLLFPRQHADSATFFHAAQRLLGVHHVRSNLVHVLLDPLQLLCMAFGEHAQRTPQTMNGDGSKDNGLCIVHEKIWPFISKYGRE